MVNKTYKDIDRAILKTLKNPSERPYSVIMEAPELTFIGAYEQPDFGKLTITMVPDKTIVELKSLKLYIFQYRDVLVSYERLLATVFEHLTEVYQPRELCVELVCAPRGGISSTLRMPAL